MSRSAVSMQLRVGVDVHGVLVAEGGECVGVDVAPGAPAPRDQPIRVDVYVDGADSRALQALLVLLGGGKPLRVRGVPAAIGKERA